MQFWHASLKGSPSLAWAMQTPKFLPELKPSHIPLRLALAGIIFTTYLPPCSPSQTLSFLQCTCAVTSFLRHWVPGELMRNINNLILHGFLVTRRLCKCEVSPSKTPTHYNRQHFHHLSLRPSINISLLYAGLSWYGGSQCNHMAGVTLVSQGGKG